MALCRDLLRSKVNNNNILLVSILSVVLFIVLSITFPQPTQSQLSSLPQAPGFSSQLQVYPPNQGQTSDFRPIIIPNPPKNGTCKPYLDRFLMNLPFGKWGNFPRFKIMAPCITIIGNVTWTHYFNNDGDANFNVVPDPAYQKYLSPGNSAAYYKAKYPGPPSIHMEVVCQAPILNPIERGKARAHACDGYNGPDFKSVLPHIGDRVLVVGRWLLDSEDGGPGINGHSELHPVYAITLQQR